MKAFFYFFMKKKGLSSIVGVLLLLSMMLVATFLVFNFYKSDSTQRISNLESQEDLDSFIDFLYIESNQLYYQNTYDIEIEFSELEIIGESCLISSGTLLVGEHAISLGACSLSNSSGIYIVVLEYGVEILSESIINKDFYS